MAVDYFLDASNPRAASELRREITAYLNRHAETPDDVWQAELVVEEMVGNAVRHAQGPVWVSLHWSGPEPILTVHDLDETFQLDPSLPDDPLAEGGRGLFLVAHLASQLSLSAKRAGGKAVSARLPVRRHAEESIDPAPAGHEPLPVPDEAGPDGTFGRDPFLRALVVQLAEAVERTQGPGVAETVVATVGNDVGGRMEDEFRRAEQIVGSMSPEQMGECYVRLKAAIDGDFFVIEATPERIVLGNRRCPFGPVVQRAPGLCRMTSSVFGGIAARNVGEATVVLEERIAVGDPGCRVVVHLGPAPPQVRHAGHRYQAPVQPTALANGT